MFTLDTDDLAIFVMAYGPAAGIVLRHEGRKNRAASPHADHLEQSDKLAVRRFPAWKPYGTGPGDRLERSARKLRAMS